MIVKALTGVGFQLASAGGLTRLSASVLCITIIALTLGQGKYPSYSKLLGGYALTAAGIVTATRMARWVRRRNRSALAKRDRA